MTLDLQRPAISNFKFQMIMAATFLLNQIHFAHRSRTESLRVSKDDFISYITSRSGTLWVRYLSEQWHPGVDIECHHWLSSREDSKQIRTSPDNSHLVATTGIECNWSQGQLDLGRSISPTPIPTPTHFSLLGTHFRGTLRSMQRLPPRLLLMFCTPM